MPGRKYARENLLFIGCGGKEQKYMFEPYAIEHIGLDYQDSLHYKDKVDLIDTTYGLLKENEYLDTVFIFCCIGTS